ncbi:hypothetical protein [Maritalea sp.]|uniref:hypothetical protein n=1 Tax=Maritalea sp. TaxID=2003361 RepID=UPI003EF65888
MVDNLILGLLPGGGHGLRVSRPGHDVNDVNLTGNQLAFDSRYNRAGVLIAYGFLEGGQTLDLTVYAEPPYFIWVSRMDANRYQSYRGASDVTTGVILPADHPGGFYILWR